MGEGVRAGRIAGASVSRLQQGSPIDRNAWLNGRRKEMAKIRNGKKRGTDERKQEEGDSNSTHLQ